jgi:hypothetical protein
MRRRVTLENVSELKQQPGSAGSLELQISGFRFSPDSGKIKATRNASHGKRHTENTEEKLFSVFSVCLFPWLEGPK